MSVGIFYEVDFNVKLFTDFLKDNEEQVYKIRKFEKENEPVLSKYLEIQNKSKEYTDSRKYIFGEYFKIGEQLTSLFKDVDSIRSDEWEEAMKMLEEETNQYAARYPKEFEEYRKINMAYDSFTAQEKQIVGDYGLKMAELKNIIDCKTFLRSCEDTENLESYAFKFSMIISTGIIAFYVIPLAEFIISKIFG